MLIGTAEESIVMTLRFIPFKTSFHLTGSTYLCEHLENFQQGIDRSILVGSQSLRYILFRLVMEKAGGM